MAEEVKLLMTWSSPFALRVVWALKLKGVQFDSIEEDLSPFTSSVQSCSQKIPVLVHNGKPISESLVILEYVDESWRQYPLLPDGPYDRARARVWAKFSDDKVSPSIWGVFIKQGKEREEAFDQVFENLKFLEEELKERDFWGEKIGFADLALGWIAERVCVLEEIIGVKIVEEEKFPLVSAWMQEFVKVPIIKESLPPHEKLVTKIRGIREKFLGAA